MLYMPAVCTGGGRWAGRYNWTDTAGAGWLLPVADEMEPFFDELFSYGEGKSAASARQLASHSVCAGF